MTASSLVRRGLAALAFSAAASAAVADTSYVVDRQIGTGRITGTIVTNGQTGVLTATDIVDWNLTIDADGDPTSVGHLFGPSSGANSTVTQLTSGVLSASATALTFDFGFPSFGLFQMMTTTGAAGWQIQASIFHDEVIFESSGSAYMVQGTTPQVIAVAQQPTFSLGLGLDLVRLRDETNEGFRFRGTFVIDSCGDGFDPETEPTSLLFSTPVGTFYPPADRPDLFPIQPGEMERVVSPAGQRWRLSEAGRLRTGIERFEIDDRDGSFVFVDRDVTLPPRLYDQVTVEITVGNDVGQASATLVERPCDSGRWMLGR